VLERNISQSTTRVLDSHLNASVQLVTHDWCGHHTPKYSIIQVWPGPLPYVLCAELEKHHEGPNKSDSGT
jgi:hypothetical protein